MIVRHEPRDEFIERLEHQIGAEVRRRQRLPARRPLWMPQSPAAAIAMLMVVTVVAMSLGGGVVAARYEAQQARDRDVLTASYEQRVALARQKVDVVRAQTAETRRRVSVGVAGEEAALDAKLQLDEVEAELRIADLRLAEVRVTGRDPLDVVSAPLVDNRDFVRERWDAQRSLQASMLHVAQAHAQRNRRRVDIGLATPIDLVVSQARVQEIELAVRASERKLEIRRQFLARTIDDVMADLRVLEADAEQRQRIVTVQMQVARERLREIQAGLQTGTAPRVDVTEAEIRLQELELDLRRSELDVTVIRRRMDERRK